MRLCFNLSLMCFGQVSLHVLQLLADLGLLLQEILFSNQELLYLALALLQDSLAFEDQDVQRDRLDLTLLEPLQYRIYVCGITHYDATHLGHANT
jgi:hypothetical protein